MNIYRVSFGKVKTYKVIKETPKGYRVKGCLGDSMIILKDPVFAKYGKSLSKEFRTSKLFTDPKLANEYAIKQVLAERRAHNEKAEELIKIEIKLLEAARAKEW